MSAVAVVTTALTRERRGALTVVDGGGTEAVVRVAGLTLATL